MANWTLRQGDTRPALRAVLKTGGDPLPLDGCSVTWKMRLVGTAGPVITGPATIEDAAKGLVEYLPAVGTTNVPGTYNGVFVVEFQDGSIATIPTVGYVTLQITPNEL